MKIIKILVPSFILIVLLSYVFIPFQTVLLLIETRTEKPHYFYVPIQEQKGFTIRYVHSIHLTDVLEQYEITQDHQLKMLEVSYENLGIGMPSSAGEDEVLELKDGVYTLTYKNKVIDSFRLHVGRVDADLTLRYKENEIDLKEYLEKGKNYEFKAVKISNMKLWKGEQLNG